MIKFTLESNGDDVYVSPEQIIAVRGGTFRGGTNVAVARIYTTDEVVSYTVKASPEEVAKKIMDYKLAMIRYTTAFASVIVEEKTNGHEMIEALSEIRFLVGIDKRTTTSI